MSAVCLIDTSVFLDILNVPGKGKNHAETLRDLRQKVQTQESLFLPMATIVETGNHIGQNGDGNRRRTCAVQFVRQVQQALEGRSPFTPLNFLEATELNRWLSEFPDWAGRGVGLG
ncbi:MAG: PIN domain-containing protein, partial [bacterium]